MIATWMLYCVAIAGMLGAAAHAGETILRSFTRPGRWVWATAMIGSIALPASALLGPRVADSTDATAVDRGLAADPLTSWPVSITALDSAVTLLDPFNPILVGVWVLSSLTLVTIVVWSCAKLVRDRRGWRRAVVGSVPVLVSSTAGPAVVGVVREDIVLPEWVLALRLEIQLLIVRHEEQHVRAGDTRLLVGALCIVLLFPWNVALWWQLRRLRLAVEADCDRRVLESGTDVDTYGGLLLEMGRRSNSPVAALAFSRRQSSLLRRIELMTWKPRFRTGRTIVASLFAAALVFAACETPLPQEPAETEIGGMLPLDVFTRIGEPLYMIDGVVVADSKPVHLDPSSIESIEVIKGGAAVRRYGDYGVNGVIIIETKKASAGSENRERTKEELHIGSLGTRPIIHDDSALAVRTLQKILQARLAEGDDSTVALQVARALRAAAAARVEAVVAAKRSLELRQQPQ